jgi:hypothetical protein
MALLVTTAVPMTAMAGRRGSEGAVFVMAGSTDPARGNEIAMYRRDRDGDLALLGYFPTGRIEAGQPQFAAGPAPTTTVLGALVPATADGHGSDDSLMLSEDNRCLFAVNAGSDSVSSFEVGRDRLRLVSVQDSRGGLPATFPVSLAVGDGLVYVLNSGGDGSVVGFRSSRDCELSPLSSAAVSLAGITDTFPSPAPGEVLTTPAHLSISPDGRRLAMTIKGGDATSGPLPNGRMVVIPVGQRGVLDAPVVTPFDFATQRGGPFGLIFTSSRTIVVTHGNSQTVGSYRINADNTLSLTSGPFPTSSFAPCWLDRKDGFVIVASFGNIPAVGTSPDGDGTLDVYRLNRDGTLAPIGVSVSFPSPGPGRSGNHAIDVRVVDDFFYFVQPRTGQVGRVTVESNGDLTDMVHFGGFAEGVEPFVGLNPGINSFLDRCFLQGADSEDRSPECRRGSPQGIVGF